MIEYKSRTFREKEDISFIVDHISRLISAGCSPEVTTNSAKILCTRYNVSWTLISALLKEIKSGKLHSRYRG